MPRILRLGSLCITAVLVVTTGALAQEEEEVEYDETVTVERIVDGDTIRIDPAVDGIDEVRLIGIDTPETKDPDCDVQPYGPEASIFTREQLQGEEVDLEFDEDREDRYERLLAYVYLDDDMFHETLLEEGYAQVYTVPRTIGTRTVSMRLRTQKSASEGCRHPSRIYWRTGTTGSEAKSAAQGRIRYRRLRLRPLLPPLLMYQSPTYQSLMYQSPRSQPPTCDHPPPMCPRLVAAQIARQARKTSR
jgi:endonuclease YncB( thermonuclease family)